MTSDLRRHLAYALIENRLRLARERQLAASRLRWHEVDPVGHSSCARRRRWIRRMRRALFSRPAGRVARPA
jgi:hypothetical protein